jgi:hypothetical protein
MCTYAKNWDDHRAQFQSLTTREEPNGTFTPGLWEDFDFQESFNGRISWLTRLFPEFPYYGGDAVDLWNTARLTDEPTAASVTAFNAWLTNFESEIDNFINIISDPTQAEESLANIFANLIAQASIEIEAAKNQLPPNINTIPLNYQNMAQYGGVFRVQTWETRADVGWNLQRTRIDCRNGEWRRNCVRVEISGGGDPAGGLVCTAWEWTDGGSYADDWKMYDGTNAVYEWSSHGFNGTAEWNYTGHHTPENSPPEIFIDIHPQLVEERQLLSARCNFDGINQALTHGIRIISPDVHNEYFGMVLSPARTVRHNDDTGSLVLDDYGNPPPDVPFRTSTNSGGGFADTNNSIFFTDIESCRLRVPCVNEIATGTSVNNRRGNPPSTNFGGTERWGANFDHPFNDPQEPDTLSTNVFQFARDNQWNDFWLDLWYPRPTAGINNIHWRHLNASGSQRTNPLAHSTQVRFHANGTPLGIGSDLDRQNMWRFESRDAITGNDNTRLETSIVPFERLIVGEHTRFRTRAAWASDFNQLHRVNFQWIYNFDIRTFTPTQVVTGAVGNRATFSGTASTWGITPTGDRNRMDIYCPATFNTNANSNANTVPQIARWHVNPAGTNITAADRAISRAQFTWDDMRTLRVGFVRPVGE